MKNKDIWQNYVDYTQTVSSVARKLGFAAIAVIWVVSGRTIQFPALIRYALFVILIFFLFDLIQYLLGSLLFRYHIIKIENQVRAEGKDIEKAEYQIPKGLDTSVFVFWLLKIGILLIGYTLIGLHVFKYWFN